MAAKHVNKYEKVFKVQHYLSFEVNFTKQNYNDNR